MRTGRAFSLGLCAALACASASVAQWPCYYTVEVLYGPPCPDFPDGQPANVQTGNESGQPAGAWGCGFGTSFPWIGAGGSFGTVLPLPPGATAGAGVRAINDVMTNTAPNGEPFGQLAGSVQIAPNDRVFFYDNNTYTILPMIPNATASFAEEVNDKPTVVGYSGNYVTWDPPDSAVLWHNGTIQNLHGIFEAASSRAFGVNQHEEVTGYFGPGLSTGTGFIWNNGTFEMIHHVPDGFSSRGEAINNNGSVAGHGLMIPEGETSAVVRSFLWRDGEMTMLGVLPGFKSTRAHDINDHDEIVGQTQHPLVGNQNRPFIWRNGVIANVNEMLDPNYTGLSANIAVANTNDGIIYVKLTVGGAKLTPVYGPFGDVNCDGVVNVHDLLKLLTHWGTVGETDLDAARCDLDENGIVNVFDLLLLLANWGATK